MITSVEMINFLSHKKNEIVFDNGVTVFIGENGAGKSSVIDAMTFSLFGKTTRGNNEMLFRDGESQTYTKTNFQINEKKFHVLKKIQRNGKSTHEILNEFGSVITKSATEVSEEIKKIIALDYDTLRIASIVPQGQLTEIIQSENGTKLRSLVDKIMGVDKYSEIEKRLKNGIKEFRQHLEETYHYNDNDVNQLENEIINSKKIILESNKTKDELEDKQIIIKNSKEVFEEQLKKLDSVESKKKILDEKENSIWNTAKSEIVRLSKESEEKLNIAKKCEPCFNTIKEKTKTIDLLNLAKRKKESLENQIKELETNLALYHDRKGIAEKIEFTDGECPICHSKDTNLDPNYQLNHIKVELEKIDGEKSKLKIELKKVDDDVFNLGKKNNEITKAENTLDNFSIKDEEQLANCNNDVKLYQNKREKLTEYTKTENMTRLVECIPNIKHKLLEIESLQNEVMNYNPDEFHRLKNEFNAKNEELDEINQQIGEEKNKNKTSREFIDQKTPILKEIRLAKEYISELEKINSSVFSTQSETFTGLRYFTINSISENASHTLEKLKTKIQHVKLHQEGNNSIRMQCDTVTGSRPVKNLSGGEQVCVALAVRLGMAELMGKSPLKIMILDEPTASLDKTHCEYFVDAIQQLTKDLNQSKNFQFIIITHDEDIWSNADVNTIYKFESSSNGTIVSRL